MTSRAWGICGAEEFANRIEGLPLRERAYLAALWLTGSRRSEVATLKKDPVSVWESGGEWWFKHIVLKRKLVSGRRPTKSAPFVLIPGQPGHDKLLGFFLAWLSQVGEGGLIFPYKETTSTVKWRTKAGEERLKSYTTTSEPWDIICRKARLSCLLENKDGNREVMPINLHWVRAFSITEKLGLGIDPLFVRDWVGHSSINTTLIYYQLVQSAWKNRINAIREKLKSSH